MNLKQKLNEIYSIILRLCECYSELKNLRESLNQDNSSIKTQYPFFNLIEYALLNSIILEISHLYGSKNDKYRFEKLINFCSSNISKIQWKNDFTLEDLRELENEVSLNYKLIEKIKDIRNESVVHKGKTETKISLDEVYSLIISSIHIYNKVSSSFQGNMILYELFENKNSSAIVKNLSKYHIIREIVLENHGKISSS